VQPKGVPADEIRARLARERARDTPFGSGRILGSMCTAPHPIALEAWRLFAETNLGDPHLCPGARTLEDEALADLGAMLHAPASARGAFVTGGSEANLTAVLLAARKKGGREVVLPESAHFSFDKACSWLGLRQITARLKRDGTVDVDDVAARLGSQTACVVGIAGTTELGAVDDIPALARICQDARVPLHVDAAWGGFVIPFARKLGRKLPDFDLALEGVTTLCVDPHKMGLAPIPSGMLFARDARDFDPLAVPSPYVSVERQPTLQGTRNGAAPAATWAVMRHLGADGYTHAIQRCLDVTAHLVQGLEKSGFPPVIPPPLSIVAFRVADPQDARRRLREQGWLVSLAPLTGGLKVVVGPHVTKEAIDGFLAVLPSCAEAA
jgi:tyrosine decarboxylase/aspartate 1-decarboxylase